MQELVIRHSKLKALGTRHSFNKIADCTEDLISLEYFNQVLAIDPARRTQGKFRNMFLDTYVFGEGS